MGDISLPGREQDALTPSEAPIADRKRSDDAPAGRDCRGVGGEIHESIGAAATPLNRHGELIDR